MQEVSNFNSISNKFLQAYNRLAVSVNLVGMEGEEASSKYMAQFSDEDKATMSFVGNLIEARGIDRVKAMIIERVDFLEDIEYEQPSGSA